MSKVERSQVCPVPEALTFRGIRKIVLQNAWARANQMVEENIPLTNEDFGTILKEEWQRAHRELIPKAIEEFKVCRQRAELKVAPRKMEARLTLVGQKAK